MNNISRPKTEEIPDYYRHYFNCVFSDNLFDAFRSGMNDTRSLISSIPAEKENFRYREDKWTLKEVLIHVIDTERIMIYRALRFARGDKTDISGFDQDNYAPNSNSSARTLNDIKEEYIEVRKSAISLFKHIPERMLDFRAKANNLIVTPRCIGWIIAGHNIHHCSVLIDSYLKINK